MMGPRSIGPRDIEPGAPPAQSMSLLDRIATPIGRTALQGVDEIKGLYSVFVRTLYYIPFGGRHRRATIQQMYELGTKSAFFVCITLGCLGMIMVYQAGLQAKRLVPDYTMLGATFLELLVRDLAASIGALMLATRVGAGIAAEIGSMVVTEQVDALRMSAADPIDFLVVPRFLASVMMTGALVICGGTAALLAGALTAHVAFEVPYHVFFNLHLVTPGDLVTGLLKSLAYGAAIPIVSAHSGLTAEGGSEGVGWATTKAVVSSSLAVIILNPIISTSCTLVFGK